VVFQRRCGKFFIRYHGRDCAEASPVVIIGPTMDRHWILRLPNYILCLKQLLVFVFDLLRRRLHDGRSYLETSGLGMFGYLDVE
jgi:hypothetical protein